jgi:hypothetical protein
MQFTDSDAPQSYTALGRKLLRGQKECPKMSLDSEIVKDTPAARRFRLLAPLAALLALAALTLAPGIIAELNDRATNLGMTSPEDLPAWTASELRTDPAAGQPAVERR